MKRIVALISVFTLLFFLGNVSFGQSDSAVASEDTNIVQKDSAQQQVVADKDEAARIWKQ